MVQRPEMVAGPVEAAEFSRRLWPIAAQLRQLAETPASEEISPAVGKLVPLTASITSGVAAALNTLTDPLGTGRHNLQGLRALGQQLAAAAAAALEELDPHGGATAGGVTGDGRRSE